MELNRPVTIFLSEKGQEALQQAVGLPEQSTVASFYALQADDGGLWVSNRKADGEHWLYIPWGCILALDVPVGGTPRLESVV